MRTRTVERVDSSTGIYTTLTFISRCFDVSHKTQTGSSFEGVRRFVGTRDLARKERDASGLANTLGNTDMVVHVMV